MSSYTHFQPLSNLEEQRFIDIHAPSEVAAHGLSPDCTHCCIPDHRQSFSNASHSSWTPSRTDFVYQSQSVWSADQSSLSTTGTSNQAHLKLGPLFSHPEEIPHDTLHVWQSHAPTRPSLREEESFIEALGFHSPPSVSLPHTLEGTACPDSTNAVFFPNAGPDFPCSGSIPEYQMTYCTEREVATATYEYPLLDARDHIVPPALVTDNPIGYNQKWSSWDMIQFNGFLRDEVEVVCQWVENMKLCNDRVKGKDFTAHLQGRHQITSPSQVYSCLWNACLVSQAMLKSSLERHVREQHFPVKWACPTCSKTFGRKSTLMGHVERCPGRV